MPVAQLFVPSSRRRSTHAPHGPCRGCGLHVSHHAHMGSKSGVVFWWGATLSSVTHSAVQLMVEGDAGGVCMIQCHRAWHHLWLPCHQVCGRLWEPCRRAPRLHYLPALPWAATHPPTRLSPPIRSSPPCLPPVRAASPLSSTCHRHASHSALCRRPVGWTLVSSSSLAATPQRQRMCHITSSTRHRCVTMTTCAWARTMRAVAAAAQARLAGLPSLSAMGGMMASGKKHTTLYVGKVSLKASLPACAPHTHLSRPTQASSHTLGPR
jgi:hypothetical protein